MLQQGSFPEKWKVLKIIPVSGDKSAISNYRPVSLLSSLSKVFEIVIHNRLYPMLKQFVSDNQHGFVSGRSTTTNLMHISQYISTAIDRRK